MIKFSFIGFIGLLFLNSCQNKAKPETSRKSNMNCNQSPVNIMDSNGNQILTESKPIDNRSAYLKKIDPNGDFTVAPEYNGGEQVLNRFIEINFHIPDNCYLQDTLIVTLEFDTTGKITKHELLNYVDYCPAIEDSINSMLKKMPVWKPAYYIDCNGVDIGKSVSGMAIKIWK